MLRILCAAPLLLGLHAGSGVRDMLEPLLNRLEKRVAARQIPPAHTAVGRQRLADVPRAGGATFDHAAWDRCLKAHVRPGGTAGAIAGVHLVDYAGLAADPDFDAYLAQLAAADVPALGARERLALYINAYNALCCAHVVRHVRDATADAPPLRSILELKSPGEVVWDRYAGTVGGERLSLNQVEHDKLRRAWAEPAVHACIVCASASCPDLRAEAFVAPRLEEQMSAQLAAWLAHPAKGAIAEGPGRVRLSRILLWFEDDWGGAAGVRAFLLGQPLADGVAAALSAPRPAVRFFEYDWRLNGA
ncbi:hypothetical protein KFE25_003576 [Diacronema lutheri]|uniref:DUF547 domain-containing protein n=1 Tax=Diacronema lutheri TaxID=2081491 RepID=A0A8J5X6Q3_DIALT|nr:hypothetical protein KFE25_003576 [Diacronema lutheri]